MKKTTHTDLIVRIFFLLLYVYIVALKLTGIVTLSWIWVLSPIWIPAAVVLAILLIVLVVAVVKVLTKKAEKEVEQAIRKDALAADIDAEAAKHGLERRAGESNTELKRRIAYMKQAERRARHD